MSLIDDRAPPELALGMPVTTERFLALGAFRHFQNGSIYASTETDAHVSRNPITAKLHNLGYAAGLLGLPLSEEVSTDLRTSFLNGSETALVLPCE